MAKIHSISLNNELEEFISENPDLSLSKILQQALYNIKNERQHFEVKLKAAGIRNNRLQKELLKSTDFIEKEGLWKKYENS